LEKNVFVFSDLTYTWKIHNSRYAYPITAWPTSFRCSTEYSAVL